MATIRKLTRKPSSNSSLWQAQVRKKGVPPLSKCFKSKSDAVLWAQTTESEIDRNLYIDRTEADQTTLADVMNRYEKEILPNKAGRIQDMYRTKVISRYLGDYSLSRITSGLLSEYRDQRLLTVSPQTVVHELGLINRVLKTCRLDWGISCPLPLVRKPKLPRGRVRRLSKEEETTLLSALHRTPTVRTIMLLALETAMRRGEILGMEWNHIDLKKRTLLIPITKTDTPRSIPLSERAIELLFVLPDKCGQVFQISPYSVTQAFRRACRREGINNLRFHDLRHEATTRLFEKGLNPVEVASITGHRDTRTLMRYTHLKAENLVKKLDSR